MNYIKNDLATLREKIRTVRNISKTAEDMWNRAEAQMDLIPLKSKFRLKHILYCLLKGRTYREIEGKVEEGNEIYTTTLRLVCAEYLTLDFEEIPEENMKGLL